MPRPRFSLIVAIYNTAAHLPACVESLLAQTFPDFELILVDDGSTDGSAALGRAFAARDPRLRFFTQTHSGVSAARNHGLSQARGDFVTFIDSDDTVSPHALRLAAGTLARDACDLVIFSVRHLLTTAPGTGEHTFILDDALHATPAAFLSELVRKRRLLIYSAGNKFYRKSLLDRHAIAFDPACDFGEDRLFNYAFLRHCGAIATRSDIIYDYYIRAADSLSRRYREHVLRDALFLHAEKHALLTHHQVRDPALPAFLAGDLRIELKQAVLHLRDHWPRLNVSARWRAVRRLSFSTYPPHFTAVTLPTRRGRLILSAIRHRRPWLLYLLLSA